MAMIDILITTILPFFLITIINILIAYKLKTETKKAKKCKKQIRLSKNESKNYQSFMKRDKFEDKPKKSVKFNDSLLISYKKETKQVSINFQRESRIKRTKVYSEATKCLFLISFVFLFLHCPLALNKINYFLNENLIPSKTSLDFDYFDQMSPNSTQYHDSTELETSEKEEIFERIACYIFYLNFSLNFFLYTYNKSKFRNIILRWFKKFF